MQLSVEEILQEKLIRLDYWRPAHARWNTLIDAYHGNYQKMWPGEFRRGESPKIANWIKLAWDRYAKLVGKIPTNHVTPSRIKRISQSKADKIEKILVHYDETSGSGILEKWAAWYLVGFGASARGVSPDPLLKGPRYWVKDPRTVLPAPGVGSTSITSSAYGAISRPDMAVMSMHSVIISETVTPTFLLDQYRDPDLNVEKFIQGDQIHVPQEMVTHMDRGHWQVVVNGQMFMEIEHDLGFVPVRFTTMYVPDQLGGQGQFEQNIGLVLAYMRLLNQKLTFNHNIVWPWLVLKGLSDIDTDARIIQLMGDDANAQFLSPPGELQAERDLDVLDRLIRVLNHDTEVLQGTAPGSIVTGAGARELNRDVKNMVLDYWEVEKPDIEFIRSAALIMDEELYGGREKPMSGRARGEQFEETYTPRKDINGNHNVVIDFGIGVGGLEGFTELMQVAAQGFVDEQTVMEQLPWVRSVSDTRRKVLLDRMEKVLFEMIASGAPTETINHLAQWRESVSKGKDPYKFITENPMPTPALPEQAPEGQLPPGASGPQGAPPQIPNIPSPAQLLALGQGRGG